MRDHGPAHRQCRGQFANLRYLEEFVRIDTAAPQQGEQAILRMTANADIELQTPVFRHPGRRCLRQSCPVRPAHGLVEAGQNHRTARQPCDGGDQTGGGGPRTGGAGNDDRAIGG